MCPKPQVSVLISSYNTPFYKLERAINSVLNQSFQDFEIVLVDDGSHNDPENKLIDFCCLHETKLTYIRKINEGQSQAINKALQWSEGHYIAILDADDEYLPNHIHSCVAQMKSFDLIASKTLTVTNKPEDFFVVDRYDQQKTIHVDNCILFATLFGKRKVFNKIKFKDGYGADAAFYEQAKKLFKVGKLDLRTYVYYRNNPESTCEKIKSKYATD
ncbi:glycosyltransferase family A protein [uncultured Cyclobacterium sp.]|uniref:glycosyltransferase family 2 protein n=1 Tax=uncultured Cyclobacterium sp. TaxID=453820 RepID=UPI0030EB3A77|tara:strand:- start:13793 stop:14440 length:648 start_codon:yes stop_codon:yes gene_type:complete